MLDLNDAFCVSMGDFYVYVHHLPDGTPFWVGKGCDYRYLEFSRRNVHYKNIKNLYFKEMLWWELVEAMKIIVIPCSSEKEAHQWEKQLIHQFRCDGHKLANMTDGEEGTSGFRRVRSLEERQKSGAKHKGKIVSQETRDLIGDANRGKSPSQEAREKIGKASKDRDAAGQMRAKRRENGWVVKPISEETREKLRVSHLGISPSAIAREKNSLAHLGKNKSSETKENMKKGWIMRKQKALVKSSA